ncbi:MAG TPA: hypothetical protein VLI05_06630 [Candidatus Saccharimonadia bacterium]|nr:hypothetical protein [Candidatus Saccharimonadia bacterium]
METDAPVTKARADRATVVLRWAVGVVLAAVVVLAGLAAVAYAQTPEGIRHPAGTHYHFRLQLIVGGQAVNFGSAAYQTPLNHDICTAKLTNEPIHFHDNLDQFAHIHWAHITGGLFLKNYGWNLVGGLSGVLGYRFDQLPKVTAVPIHGHVLPAPPAGAHYYIYTGDQTSYQQRNWNDFLHQDINVFFGHPTISAAQPTSQSWWLWLVPTASAHGDETELTELNHVVGSAVIFVQPEAPTAAQIKDRFNHLIPLPTSTCGG